MLGLRNHSNAEIVVKICLKQQNKGSIIVVFQLTPGNGEWVKFYESLKNIYSSKTKAAETQKQLDIRLKRYKMPRKHFHLIYSILFYPITLEGRRGTTDEFATIPFHLDLFSAALVELAKSIPVHSLILSSHLFFCLPLFFSFHCAL